MSPLSMTQSPRSTPVQPAMLGGLPPPPGVVPNFVNPNSIADTIRAVAIFLAVVTTLSTAIRLYTKFFIVKAHGWEDYTMFIAWAGFIAWIAVGLQDLKYGLGTHQWDVPITKLVSLALWANVSEILYPPLIAITRLSICLQFAHIFVLNRDKKFWYLQVFICINILYFIALFFVTIFQCTPRAKIWNPEIPGKCLRFQAYTVATGLFNVVSDFLMLSFPIFCIWHLQMSNKRKVGVSAIFFVGSLALTASILRVVFSGISEVSQDQTFNLARVGECTVGEVAAGILVGNLVVFPRFFTTYVPKVTRLLSSYRSRRSSEPLLDTTPTKASPSWSRAPNAKVSASWPNQHSARALPEDFVELKDQGYKAGGLVPYAGGKFSPTTNVSRYIGNHESRPYEFRGSGNESRGVQTDLEDRTRFGPSDDSVAYEYENNLSPNRHRSACPFDAPGAVSSVPAAVFRSGFSLFILTKRLTDHLPNALRFELKPAQQCNQVGQLRRPQTDCDTDMNASSTTRLDINVETIDDPSSGDSNHASNPASCTLCRRRKVKCDRTTPCGNCQRSKAECVPFIPSRAARGRQGGRKRKRGEGEILERIAKLEGLVRSIEGHDTPQGEQERVAVDGTIGTLNASVSGGTSEIRSQYQPAAPRLDKYLAASFWVSLSEEIHGLKDVLGESSDDGDEEGGEMALPTNISSSGQQNLQQSNHSGFAILRTTIAEDIIHPKPHQVYTFCDAYLANVDPIFKILHGPSLRKYLQENAAELDCSTGRRGLEALRFAIYYAAVTSMETGECRHRIGENRTVLLARYRAATESALAKADFINTVEMSTLQALVIYLGAVRANDTSRLMWTLTSLAVRIAEGMGLHQDSTTSSFGPFENEMRRRLWWQICDLDSHAADDRASNHVIAANSFSTKLPLHINDEDISFDSVEEVMDREGYTDMTFALSCHEVLDAMRNLLYIPASTVDFSEAGSQEMRGYSVDNVINLQRHIKEKYLRHLNLTRPFHWFIRIVADVITAVMWLLIYRPMKRRPSKVSSFQLAHPDILRLSVDVLERFHQLATDPALSQFRWLSQTYVQWHALAVTIAELCVETEGPMVERAWAVVELSFQQAAQHVADSDRGMLWRPIKKLMSRAREIRQKYLNSRLAMTTPSSSIAAFNTLDQMDASMETRQSNSGTEGYTNWPVENFTHPIPESHQAKPPIATSEPFDWDPWFTAATAATTATTQSQYSPNMDAMAWTNWEDFINDVEAQGDAVSGLNDVVPGSASA